MHRFSGIIANNREGNKEFSSLRSCCVLFKTYAVFLDVSVICGSWEN